MGMAASQAKFLSITARLTNNENTGQSISYSKQRLADQTQQITNEYNEALDATKLTVLTGFNGAEANYEDISYNLMTGMQMAKTTKQYVVTDNKGKVLVTEQIADAYTASHGDYNRFLAELGYSQSDLLVNKKDENWKKFNDEGEKIDASTGDNDAFDDNPSTVYAKQKIHEAWDKYFETVGINLPDIEHEKTNIPEFKWENTKDDGEYHIGNGYTSYYKTDENGEPIDVWMPINYEGTTKESRDLFDYAMSITEAYYRDDFPAADEIKTAANMDNTSDIKYYRNLFNKIQQNGYFTYTETAAKAINPATKDNYIYYQDIPSDAKRNANHMYSGNAEKIITNPLKDNYTFEAALRNGTLKLEYYSATEKGFKSITVSEDNCIQEVPDERAIAKAELKYNQDMADLEQKDKKFDLELKKLDTEHNALQTEYESVKNVVDKNVESTFKTFS